MGAVRTSMRSLLLLACALALHACKPKELDRLEAKGLPPPLPMPQADAGPRRCIVHLHGKGEHGKPARIEGDLVHVWPEGNGEGWGGRQWLYFPAGEFEQVRMVVLSAILAAACDRVILHGFSNGASAAAKLVCAGESFGGKLAGAIIDDPVPDRSLAGCTPAPGVKLKLYVTGGLSHGVAGTQCKKLDWTCEGDTLVGIDEYARLLGAPKTQSPNTQHAPLAAPEEYATWW